MNFHWLRWLISDRPASSFKLGQNPIGANLRKKIGKKGEEKGHGMAFGGTVKTNLGETYQEKRHALSEASYDERGPFARKWQPG
jgi:hypothetical protein